MNKSIYITTLDQQRLQDLLAETAASGPRQQGDWKALADELRRAVIVQPNEVPADVITMNSRAEVGRLRVTNVYFQPEAALKKAA